MLKDGRTDSPCILQDFVPSGSLRGRCPAYTIATIIKYQSRARVPMTISCLWATGSLFFSLFLSFSLLFSPFLSFPLLSSPFLGPWPGPGPGLGTGLGPGPDPIPHPHPLPSLPPLAPAPLTPLPRSPPDHAYTWPPTAPPPQRFPACPAPLNQRSGRHWAQNKGILRFAICEMPVAPKKDWQNDPQFNGAHRKISIQKWESKTECKAKRPRPKSKQRGNP